MLPKVDDNKVIEKAASDAALNAVHFSRNKLKQDIESD